MECVHSGLDLFQTPGLQTSVQSGTYVEYRPLAALDEGPIEFSIKGSANYLDLANTFLKVKAKITQPDGTDLPAAANVVPVNLLLHSLFSDVNVFLNGVQITSPSGAYAYQAYIQTLLSYSPAVKESQLESAFFYADTAGHFNEVEGERNKGMVKRKALSAESKTLDMMGRLHSDIFHQGKYLLNYLDVRVKLSRSKDSFLLTCARDGGNYPPYKVKIIEAGLYVRSIEVSPVIALAHAATLEKANAVYPMTKTIMRVFSAAQGSLSLSLDNLFMEKLPNRVVMSFIRGDSFNGHFGLSAFEFPHCDVNYLTLYHQGKEIPSKALRPDFPNRQYTRAFMSMFHAVNSTWGEHTSGITLDDYANGYTLFCFDLTPSLTHCDAAVELAKSGPLQLEVRFGTALPRPTNLIVLAEMDGSIEISKTREVLVL